MEGYRLSHLINVFSVPYSFLLPVFTDGESLFFQKICNHKIERFEETALESFATSTQMEFFSMDRRFNCGDDAVYAIQIGEKIKFVGDARTLQCIYQKINREIPTDCSLDLNMKHFLEKCRDIQLSQNFSKAFYELCSALKMENKSILTVVFSDNVLQWTKQQSADTTRRQRPAVKKPKTEQKGNSNGSRVGELTYRDSRLTAYKSNVGDLIVEDYNIKKHLKATLHDAGVAKIEIERDNVKVKINLHCSRPGVVIGKDGKEIEKLCQNVEAMIDKKVAINIIEIRIPDLNAQLVAENIAAQLEKRISFRRAMKQAMQRATHLGAEGIKCTCAGRLGGAETARSATYHEGTIPLQALRADIEYGFAEANTTYGKVGCKVWIYKGEDMESTLRKPPLKKPIRPKALRAMRYEQPNRSKKVKREISIRQKLAINKK